jgi:molybdate transport system substrate-binding protein
MTQRLYTHYLLGIILLVFSTCSMADQKITVYAAASLTNAIAEIAIQYEKEQGIRVVGSYAASSALAKQIENGAPADVFISADLKWMNYLQDKSRIIVETRKHLLTNKLVLIAPKGQGFKVRADKSFDLSKAFDGRLCTGDLESVPVGIYAKQSLMALNWWSGIKSRIVGTQDVRAALAFVERGECTAGIVYETDARISGKTEVIATLPSESHDPIVYPVAVVAGAKPEARAFADYLSSPQAGNIFLKYGFSINGR